MPSGQNEGIANAFTYIEGTANFPYQILLVSFHLQYRNDFGTYDFESNQVLWNFQLQLCLQMGRF